MEEEQKRLELNLMVETVGLPKSNYFLIRQPSNATEEEIKKRAKSSPLRYDSLVFGFRMDNGKITLLQFLVVTIPLSKIVYFRIYLTFEVNLYLQQPIGFICLTFSRSETQPVFR